MTTLVLREAFNLGSFHKKNFLSELKGVFLTSVHTCIWYYAPARAKSGYFVGVKKGGHSSPLPSLHSLSLLLLLLSWKVLHFAKAVITRWCYLEWALTLSPPLPLSHSPSISYLREETTGKILTSTETAVHKAGFLQLKLSLLHASNHADDARATRSNQIRRKWSDP